MTDLELSKALALAIGWTDVLVYNHIVWVRELKTSLVRNTYAPFDYRDWSVIGPIAERYNKFPYAHRGKDGLLDGKWVMWPNTLEATPQKAIALAVIQGAKK